jgi:hypothetical protein
MTKFYSASTRGFYDEDIHGARLIEHVTTDPETGETLDRWTEPNPDCKIPSDAVEITGDQHEALLAAESSGKIIQADANGTPIAVDRPAPTAGEIEVAKIAAAETAVQKLLDDAAKAEGYDGILSAASYAALPVGEPFQAEGAAFALWRAKCWARCYEVLAAVKAGTRDEPTIDELLAEMPALVLP